MSEPGASTSALTPVGVVALAVRGAVMAFAFGAIIAAAVAVGTLNDFLDGGTLIGTDLDTDTRGTAGWIIFVGISAIVIMGLFIFLGITSRQKKIVHAIGIVFNVLLGLGYFAGGVAAAKFANDWADLGDLFGLPSELETVMRSLAAAAAMCFISDVVLLVLVIVSVVLLAMKE